LIGVPDFNYLTEKDLGILEWLLEFLLGSSSLYNTLSILKPAQNPVVFLDDSYGTKNLSLDITPYKSLYGFTAV
jgi:hypothetical protein